MCLLKIPGGIWHTECSLKIPGKVTQISLQEINQMESKKKRRGRLELSQAEVTHHPVVESRPVADKREEQCLGTLPLLSAALANIDPYDDGLGQRGRVNVDRGPPDDQIGLSPPRVWTLHCPVSTF